MTAPCHFPLIKPDHIMASHLDELPRPAPPRLLWSIFLFLTFAASPALRADDKPASAEPNPFAEGAEFKPDESSVQSQMLARVANAEQSIIEPGKIQELIKTVRPSIATITYAGRNGTVEGTGTGFIISKDGLIATNLHVIGEARPITVELDGGAVYPVTEIQAWDRKLDLAIIRIDAHGLQPLEMGDSDKVTQGQPIIAFGSPQGLKFSVVQGVVSATRQFEDDELPVIQVAIPIEQGNSGGPIIGLDGNVLGVVTWKSVVTDNLGFATPINSVKTLFEDPNPVPIERWLTIGVLDPHKWTTLMGSHWTQRAGTISASGFGSGFGGRSLCLLNRDLPSEPYEVSVRVRMDDESGAAGLVFRSNNENTHYGLYPSSGKIRLTRFEGPDVYSWTILEQIDTEAYVPGDWNHFRVRLDGPRIQAFVNGTKIIDMVDGVIEGGQAGLCKFRHTVAEYKDFRIGQDLSEPSLSEDVSKELQSLIDTFAETGNKNPNLIETLSHKPDSSRLMIEAKAQELEERALELRQLTGDLHQRYVTGLLSQSLSGSDTDADLLRAGLYVSLLDNPDLDVEGYVEDFDRMTEEIRTTLGKDSGDEEKFEAVVTYLFQESGFHGSRTDYYHRSNSYLNEVLDDREGIPITLSIILLEVAERLGIQHVSGVPLPGHFMVQYAPPNEEPRLIDVFDGGREVTREEAEKIVIQSTGGLLEPHHLTPATKKDIIVRMLRNLIGITMDQGDANAALPYIELVLAISPEESNERFSRALLRYQNGDNEGAKADLEWLLENQPAGLRLDRLQELYERL